jgi:hypothetical protein
MVNNKDENPALYGLLGTAIGPLAQVRQVLSSSDVGNNTFSFDGHLVILGCR